MTSRILVWTGEGSNVNALDWHKNEDGWAAPGYVIRPSDRHPGAWRLETTAAAGAGSRIAQISFHPSARAAKRRAYLDEQDRIRRERARGHVVVATGSALLTTVLLSQMASLEAFVLAMVFLYLAVYSFAEAVSVTWADAWNWNQGPPAATSSGLMDRAIGAVARWLRARQLEATQSDQPGAIIMLPPPEENPAPTEPPSRATMGR